jgi:hypothetical protein
MWTGLGTFGTDRPASGGVIMTNRFLLLLLFVSGGVSGGCSRALVAVKRDFADAYQAMQADLDCHADDGLETFDPKSAAIVRQMRNEARQ